MSMFKRMLASVGIGAAQVNLMLHQDVVSAGDSISGIVRIQGGKVSQQIDDVHAFVMTRYVKEQNDSKRNVDAVIAKFRLAGKFTAEAGQVYEFPVSFQLPASTPATMGRTQVWIQTGLDISDAIDPTDVDRLQVRPHRYSATVLEAVNQMGFRLREVSCEYSPRYGQKNGVPFVQEFEFVPSSQFRGHLDELEIFFYPDETGVELLLQVDRKVRGFSSFLAEAAGTDESFVRIRFSREHLDLGTDYIAGQLANLIQKYI